jgi:hypothetical protein
VELVRVAVLREPAPDDVDPVRDDEDRARGFLGEEVPERPVHRAREAHGDPVHADERIRAVESRDAFRVAAGDARARLLRRNASQARDGGIGEIDDLGDGFGHRASSSADPKPSRTAGRRTGGRRA